MKYQLGIYDPGPESWRFHRKDYEIVHFDSRDDAEQAAIELSKSQHGREVLVLTVHVGFKTDTEYPRPEPRHFTKRFDVFARSESAPKVDAVDPVLQGGAQGSTRD